MKLHHIAITVKDLTVSIPFYEEYFGFREKIRFRRDDMGATGCFLEGDNVMLELLQFDTLTEGVKEELSFTGIKHIAFTYSHLEILRNEFNEKGIICGPLTAGASGGQYFFLSDPDGNQIEVYRPAILN